MTIKIPVASMTTQELREHLAQLLGEERYDFAVRLIDEIARLRDTEVVVCRTKWSDSEPQKQDVSIDPEPATRLELIELTRMMGAARYG